MENILQPFDDSILEENRRRNEALCQHYDTRRGIGCAGSRTPIRLSDFDGEVFVPSQMLSDEHYLDNMSWSDHAMLRIRYDFEFWCAECVTIKDKTSSRNIAFKPNAPQRRIIAELEKMRCSQRPIRLIMLKARQWGGSTLIQIYMAWMQIVMHKQWNSLICGHLKDTSASIKGIYGRLLANYPKAYSSDGKMAFRPFEKSHNVSEISGRQCLVAVGSSESQEAIRGYDIAMAHLTEVAFWRSTPQKSPDSLIRSVCGSVALIPDSIIVLESTANGVGNFFHTEWLRSKAGLSDKVAVFVPWYEIEIYRQHVSDPEKLWNSLDDYEHGLWNNGLTLEMIQWYHLKRKEYSSHSLMKAEYPSNDLEAFALSGRMVFDAVLLDRLRRDCIPPRLVGELQGNAESGSHCLEGLHMVESQTGMLKVWKKPDKVSASSKNRYIVVVDVGGRSDNADFSVIAVIDRLSFCGKPEVVAQWRGHIDHDRLAWKAAQIAKWYNDGYLVIESNTLETDHSKNVGGRFVLDSLASSYRNLYTRSAKSRMGDADSRYGFHTNTITKPCAIYELIRQVRDALYIEHDSDAIDEMSWFEMKSASVFGAMSGRHDDILITRAIAFYVILEKFRNASANGISDDDRTSLTLRRYI